jgi:uncharacterized membrane protein (DUF373 family)
VRLSSRQNGVASRLLGGGDAACHSAAPPPSGARRWKESGMALRDVFKRRSWIDTIYDRFEQIISGILLVIISLIIVYSTGLVVLALFNDLHAGVHFAEQGALKDTFGLILSLLILIEFNHSIALAMRRRSGVLQVRVVILIAIIVIARKLILLDYASVGLNTLLGLGALALSLGVLYWLLTDVDHRRPPSAPAE